MYSRRFGPVARHSAVAALVLVLVVPAAAVGAGISGSPVLSLHAANDEFSPGEAASLDLTVVNTGNVTNGSLQNPALTQEVTTARGTTLTVRSGDAPVEVRGGPVALGSVPQGAVPATVRLVVDEDAEPGTYRLPVRVAYTYTRSIDDDGSYNETEVEETRFVQIEVTEASRFDVVAVDDDTRAGESGSVSVTLRNDGDATARDATVSLSSASGDLSFGPSGSADTFVGDWPAGENRTVTVRASVEPDAAVRALPVDATVSWSDGDGLAATDGPLSFGVEPADERAFALRDVESSLRVGAEGTVAGTVENTGPGDATNAVLVLQPTGEHVHAAETEYALGDLAAGESTRFSYDLDVSTSAREGPRQFTFRVEHEGATGSTLRSDPLSVRADVEPRRDTFDVSVQDARFTAGSSGEFAVDVTNEGDEPLSDISGKLFADAPVSATDDEAFVSTLAPGQTRTFVFGVSVAGSARPKAYPVSVDFQYTEPDGDTKLSDAYRLPVTVESREGGGFLHLGSEAAGAGGGVGLGLGAAALALATIGGVWRFR